MPAAATATATVPLRPVDARAIAKLSNEEIMELTTASARNMASLAGLIVLLTGELDRREGWRDEGATSLEAWMVERLGISVTTAKALAHVGGRLFDLPHLAEGLSSGELSFDKVRAVVDTATPETDRELRDRAQEHSVSELHQVARSRQPSSEAAGLADYERRSVRFNDTFRTMTAQLPAETYAEVRTCLEAAAKQVPSDGGTPWDQRLCDAFVGLIRIAGGAAPAASRYTVVAHAPLEVLLDDSSDLAGELERNGFICADTVRRVACDATVILAVDDDVGHTMYEGRVHRYPTESQRREIARRDRHCRFPGCTNGTFVHPHHIKWWTRDRGPTDLSNLALLCDHHHHLVHSKQWTMSGNANEVLTVIGPSGRVMTSKPALQWTAVSTSGARATN